MQQVNFNKQMQSIYKQYLKSTNGSNLYNCYDKPSYAKQKAMDYCEKLCNEYNGYDLTIIGYNTMQFSVGFMYYKDNHNYFVYITKQYNKVCCID